MLTKLSNGICIDIEKVTYVSELYTPSGKTANVKQFYFTYDGVDKYYRDDDGKLHKELTGLTSFKN